MVTQKGKVRVVERADRPWRANRNAAFRLLLGSLALSSCFRPDDGREPPLDRIYFPTGLALSEDGSRLYVANSDWDLQFNAGSVQAYDVEQMRSLLPASCREDGDCEGGDVCHNRPVTQEDGSELGPTYFCMPADATNPCGERGTKPLSRRLLEPGVCAPVDNRDERLLLGSVGVGAFATDLIYRSNPRGGGRLFVPVRSDATLHWIDVKASPDGPGEELECGQAIGEGQRQGHCDDDHRRGNASDEAADDGERLPIEPYGLAASADGTILVTAHQTRGQLGLFVNDWSEPEQGPRLRDVLGGLLIDDVAQLVAIPVPRVAREGYQEVPYQPGFWASFRSLSRLQLIRYFDADHSATGRPFLERSRSAPILGATRTADVRSLDVSDVRRRTCEDACAQGETQCLLECSRVPLEVFLTNRVPSSLMIGHTVNTRLGELPSDEFQVTTVVPIVGAPTTVVLGDVLTAGQEPAHRAFVLSFDASTLTIVDTEAQSIEAIVQTGRGPTDIQIDPVRGLGYVSHFTDSYIGVLDLDRSHPTYGSMILTLGTPTPPRGDR